MHRSLLTLFVVASTAAPVAAETVGAWSFEPPSGYKADSIDVRRTYTKITGTTFCTMAVFVPRVGTDNAATDVDKEWADLVTSLFTATKIVTLPPKDTKQKLKSYTRNASISDKNGAYYTQLVVLRSGGLVGSVMSMSNTAKTHAGCGPAVTGVLDSMTVASGASASPPALATAPASTPLVGKWSWSFLNQDRSSGMSLGSIVRQYDFRADGSYTFRSETWFGHHGPPRWYIKHEVGSYAISGTKLTVTPRSMNGVVKDDKGKVVKTEQPPAETTTYEFGFHYFAGIQETQLVLTGPKETVRDGKPNGSTLFPNSFLYGSQHKVEWRHP